jgi:hypothetical protein
LTGRGTNIGFLSCPLFNWSGSRLAQHNLMSIGAPHNDPCVL